MAVPTPDIDVAGVISTAVAELTTGTNLFVGPVRGYDKGRVPHKAVFITAEGGAPSRQFALAVEYRPNVDIRVRGDKPSVPSAFSDGQTLARAVFDAVHFNPPSGYCDAQVVNSHPIYIGQDEDGHHEWVITVNLIVDAP